MFFIIFYYIKLDERAENRLKQVYHRIKKKYTTTKSNTPSQSKSVNDEIKQMLDEFRSNKDKENQQKLTDYEITAQKVD